MTTLKIILAAVVAALICGLAYAAFTYRQAYYGLRLKFARFEQQYSNERTKLAQRSSLWHGRVESIDTQKGEFTMSMGGQTLAGEVDVVLPITVTVGTLFVRQQLVSENGVYVGFSETVTGSLADLAPGMLIAVSFTRDPDTSKAIADIVMYGGTL